MGLLASLLALVALGLGFWCWWLYAELEARTEEVNQVRRQFDQYLSDDQRTFDTLWNRAQIEATRVVRSRSYQ
jgi:hypothetical protein